MSMDSLFIAAVVRELRATLTAGAAVSKVYQPASGDIVIRFWTGRQNLRLLLSVAPTTNRLHLIATNPPNPALPPRFSQLLRARLGRFVGIEQIGGERIVRLAFVGREGEALVLVAELLGSRGNLFLLDGAGVVIDSLHRAGDAQRSQSSGSAYNPPSPRPGLLDLEQGLPSLPADIPFAEWLRQRVSPMPPLLAEDLALQVRDGKEPLAVLADFRRRYLAGDFTPILGVWRQRPVLSAITPTCAVLDAAQSFVSPSAAAAEFFASAADNDSFLRTEIHKVLTHQRRRLEQRRTKIASEAVGPDDAGVWQRRGELLLGHLHALRRGMPEAVVTNWYADPPATLTIILDPALTPQQNAERCFVRSRKIKRGAEHRIRRLAETAAEEAWLGDLLYALNEAASAADLMAIHAELCAAGLLKASRQLAPRRSTAMAGVLLQTMTPGGFRLLWGKNRQGNARVSRQETAADDLWFHAYGLPGCHLVLKRDGFRGEIPVDDRLYAASLAAGYSQGQGSAKVEVMMAAGRSVSHPKGALPGQVTVRHYTTLLVAPQRLGATVGSHFASQE